MRKKERGGLVLIAAAALVMALGLVAIAVDHNEPTAPAGFNVQSNQAVKIMASRSMQSAVPWSATGGYEQGDVVSSTSHPDRLYWNVYNSWTNITPTTATAPDHQSGDVADVSGLITWRRIPARQREGFSVVNSSTGDVWLAVGHAAVYQRGILLKGSGGAWSIDNDSMQDYVTAIINGAITNLVVTDEW